MNFRRIITAMALLAFCIGMASAQVYTNGGTIGGPAGPLTCTATAAVPPALRSEGLTELIGDIVITCTGGTAVAGVVPVANITVSLGTNVTSRLLSSGPAGYATNTSEALLFIDEPTTGGGNAAAGPGPNAPFNFCLNTVVGAGAGGCVQTLAGDGTVSSPAGTATNVAAAANVLQGVVSANQVTFNGVPVLPPVSVGVARVYRVTNVRANVSALGGGGLAGTTQLLASISISGSTSLPINNAVQVAGLIQSGLTTSLRSSSNGNNLGSIALNQCGGGGPSAQAVARFSELFPSSFKTRVAPTSAYNGQSSTPTSQNVPGTIYPSESGLVVTTAASSQPAGLADYGTRLKAVFNNVPAGVHIYVSTTNVINAAFTAPPSTTSVPYAVLVVNETAGDSNGFPPVQTGNATFSSGGVTVNIYDVPISNGTGTAVWEVINTNPNQLEGLDFAIYQSFTANPGANSPPPGTATVNMSFAPTPTAAFSAAAGGVASASLSIPRFADTSTGTNVLTIVLCNTVLLYPFVTNQAGFDTGMAIANTTTDPFGTKAQHGTCTLNFYGDTAPPPYTTPDVPTATVWTDLTSVRAPGFQGYMIAVCNFQLAHGFAFVSDLGARNLAMGYLALILPTGTGNRNNMTEALNN